MRFALVLTLALAVVAPVFAAGDIANGGFEQGVTGWELFNARVDSSPGAAHGGVTCITGWLPAHVAKYCGVRTRFHLQPGAEYEVSFWARSDNGKGYGAVWADFATDSDNRIIFTTREIPNQWTEYQARFRARRSDTTLDFHVPETWVGGPRPGEFGARAWIDDISIRRTESPIELPKPAWQRNAAADQIAFDPENGYDTAPCLTADGAGNLYLAWLRNVKDARGGEVSNQVVMLRYLRGDKWSQPVAVSSGASRRLPAAIAGVSNGAWVAWPEEKPDGSWRILARRFAPTGGSTLTVVDDGNRNRAVAVAVDNCGNPWFAWETSKSGLSGVAVRKYDVAGKTLGETVYPSRDTGNGQYPAVAVDSKGGVWVAWSAFVGSEYQLWVQRLGSEPVRLDVWPWDNLRPTLCSSAGRIWVAWNTSTRENPQHRQYPAYKDDQRWYAYKYRKGVGVACTDGDRWYLPPSTKLLTAQGESTPPPKTVQAGGMVYGAEQPRVVATGRGAPLLICRTLEGRVRSDGWSSQAIALGPEGWSKVEVGLDEQGLSAPAAAASDARGNVWIAQQQDSRVSGGYFQRFDGESWICVRKLPGGAGADGWEKSLREMIRPPETAVVPAAQRTHKAIEIDGKTYKLFFGDLHLHTDMSTCAKKVQDMQDDSFKAAYYAGWLDFAMFADHGEHMNRNDWSIQKAVTSANYVPGTFAMFSGEEFTSQMIGHKNIVYADMSGRRFDSRKNETLDLWRLLQPGKAITIPHHPADRIHTTDWDYYDPRFVKLVEIFQARLSHEAPGAPYANAGNVPGSYVSDALARGYRMGFVAGPDHPGKFGVAAVYATDLTREAIFDALIHKRCYAAVEPTVFLDVRVDGRLMGETIPAEPRKSPHEIKIHVETRAPIESLVLIRNGEEIRTFADAVGSRSANLTYVDEHPEQARLIGKPTEKTVFYYVRVIEAGERKTNIGEPYKRMAWSSPVWITLDPEPSGVADYKVLEPAASPAD